MNQTIIEIIAFSIYTLLFFTSLILLVKSLVRNKKLSAEVALLNLERVAFTSHIDQLETAKESGSVEGTQGFLRFISESRDWAFEYIENVQEAIGEYDEALSTNDAAKISAAYNKMINMLPKENEDAV
jgi:hypothetical protein